MDEMEEKMDLALTSDFAASLLNWDVSNSGDTGTLIGQEAYQRQASHHWQQEREKGIMNNSVSSAFIPTAPSPLPAGANIASSNEPKSEHVAAMERLQAFQMANNRVNQSHAATQLTAVGPHVPIYTTNQQIITQHQVPHGYIQVPQHLIHQQLAFNHQAAVNSNTHQQQVVSQPFIAAARLHNQPSSMMSVPTSSCNNIMPGCTNSSQSIPVSTMPLPQQSHKQLQSSSQAHLHPLAMQASANCPTHVPGTLPALNFNIYPNVLQGSPFLPFMINQHLQPGTVTTNPPYVALLQSQQQSVMIPHTSQQVAQQQQQQQESVVPLIANTFTPNAVKVPTTVVPKTQGTKPGKSNSKGAAVPPFMLFDAPVELRTNFLASQRMHNLPLYQDCNTIHYGMAVNGFHPQLNAQMNPVSTGALSMPSYAAGSVKLIDGRSNKPKAGRERNEREQKRAQKITELIEDLRLSMEKGGWKVEMKSKYHTLSTCADYVKHLIGSTQAKEEAVGQAKNDLAMSERKLEEKMLEQSRSDPESVTSSLTANTASMENGQQQGRARRKRNSASATNGMATARKKMRENDSSTDEFSSGDDQGSEVRKDSINKMSSSISDVTDTNRGSSESGGDRTDTRRQDDNEDDDDDDVAGKPHSCISSTAAVVRGEIAHTGEHGRSDVVIRVKKGKSTKMDSNKKEMSSLERDFDLDYEEVFVASNVPQLLATPSGRVITANAFFLKATGLTKWEAARLTIFSIVQPDKLSDLFQLVAEALRQDITECDQTRNNHDTVSSTSDGHSSGHTSRVSGSSDDDQWDYSAITLPCIAFPSKGQRKHVSPTHHPNPLYMTVTLMKDSNPKKRCFHCALTDCPGIRGQMGLATPELLDMLFSKPIEDERCTDTSSRSGNDNLDGDNVVVKDENDLGMMMDY